MVPHHLYKLVFISISQWWQLSVILKGKQHHSSYLGLLFLTAFIQHLLWTSTAPWTSHINSHGLTWRKKLYIYISSWVFFPLHQQWLKKWDLSKYSSSLSKKSHQYSSVGQNVNLLIIPHGLLIRVTFEKSKTDPAYWADIETSLHYIHSFTQPVIYIFLSKHHWNVHLVHIISVDSTDFPLYLQSGNTIKLNNNVKCLLDWRKMSSNATVRKGSLCF